MTAEVPRLATSGTVQLVPDASVDGAGTLSPVRIDGPSLTVDDYRDAAGFAFHNYTPSLTLGQMTAAYGKNQVYFTPNLCHAITFGLLNCRVSTPIPDPWALVVLEIANRTMGGGSGGACFGIARTSQQILRGRLGRTRFGNDAAANAFELGMPGGAGGRLQETINANHLQQLSADYLELLRRQDDQQRRQPDELEEAAHRRRGLPAPRRRPAALAARRRLGYQAARRRRLRHRGRPVRPRGLLDRRLRPDREVLPNSSARIDPDRNRSFIIRGSAARTRPVDHGEGRFAGQADSGCMEELTMTSQASSCTNSRNER